MSRAIPLKEIAEMLGVSLETVARWAATGELRTVNLSRDPRSGKPRRRVLTEDLDRFLRGRASDAERPAKRRRAAVMEGVKEWV